MKKRNRNNPFCAAALLVPTIEAAMGRNWLITLTAGLFAILLWNWIEPTEEKWLNRARAIACAFLLNWAMEKTHTSWPAKGAEYAVPFLLLIMAAYAVGKGNGIAVRAVNVMRYGMYLVLGLIFLLGIKEIRLDALTAQGGNPNPELWLVLLLPLLLPKENTAPLPVWALTASIITAGTVYANLYDFSRNLEIQGITEHFESITACAVTIGWFSCLCCLLETVSKENVWIIAGLAGVLYVLNIRITTEFLVIAVALLWCAIPGFTQFKKKWKKQEKSA